MRSCHVSTTTSRQLATSAVSSFHQATIATSLRLKLAKGIRSPRRMSFAALTKPHPNRCKFPLSCYPTTFFPAGTRRLCPLSPGCANPARAQAALLSRSASSKSVSDAFVGSVVERIWPSQSICLDQANGCSKILPMNTSVGQRQPIQHGGCALSIERIGPDGC